MRVRRSWAVLVAAALVAIGGLLRPATAAPGPRYLTEVFDEVTVTSAVAYGAAPLADYHRRFEDLVVDGRQTLLLDLYEPAGDNLTQRPVFIWAHGGGGTGGRRDGAFDVETSTAFARRGWVVASIDYRLMAPFGPVQGLDDLGLPLPSFIDSVSPYNVPYLKDAQHDMQAAVRWIRANAADLRIDPDKVMVGGHSAGTAPALYANFAEPSDVGDSGNPGYPSQVSAAMASSGGMLWPDSISPGDPPIVTFNALDDSYYSVALTMGNACLPTLAVGNVCDYTIYGSGGHNLEPHIPEVRQHTARFFCDHVLLDCG